MAQNWQNNGETLRFTNNGDTLSHGANNIKGGDLVLVGADVANVDLKGVAMTDIMLLANISEMHYNVGSVCRIGEWLFNAILSADLTEFTKLNYNVADKIFTDNANATKIAVASVKMVDPKVEPKALIDASGKITLTTFTPAGTGAGVVNEVLEITITKSSDLGAGTPVQAEFSIVGNNGSALVESLTVGDVLTDVFGVNTINLTLTAVAGVDVYEGQKFYIATIGDNSAANIVAGAGLLTAAAVLGANMAVPTSTVAKGLNQDEGPQGNVGKVPVLINI